jgi:hypothetical protein
MSLSPPRIFDIPFDNVVSDSETARTIIVLSTIDKSTGVCTATKCIAFAYRIFSELSSFDIESGLGLNVIEIVPSYDTSLERQIPVQILEINFRNGQFQ